MVVQCNYVLNLFQELLELKLSQDGVDNEKILSLCSDIIKYSVKTGILTVLIFDSSNGSLWGDVGSFLKFLMILFIDFFFTELQVQYLVILIIFIHVDIQKP